MIKLCVVPNNVNMKDFNLQEFIAILNKAGVDKVTISINDLPVIFEYFNNPYTGIAVNMIIKYVGFYDNALCFNIVPQTVHALCLDSACQIDINTDNKKFKGIKNIKFVKELVLSAVGWHITHNNIELYFSRIVSENDPVPCLDLVEDKSNLEDMFGSPLVKTKSSEKTKCIKPRELKDDEILKSVPISEVNPNMKEKPSTNIKFPENCCSAACSSLKISDATTYLNELNKKFNTASKTVVLQEFCIVGTKTFDIQDIFANLDKFMPIVGDNSPLLDGLTLKRFRIESELDLERMYLAMCESLMTEVSSDQVQYVYTKLSKIEKDIDELSQNIQMFAYSLSVGNQKFTVN